MASRSSPGLGPLWGLALAQDSTVHDYAPGEGESQFWFLQNCDMWLLVVPVLLLTGIICRWGEVNSPYVPYGGCKAWSPPRTYGLRRVSEVCSNHNQTSPGAKAGPGPAELGLLCPESHGVQSPFWESRLRHQAGQWGHQSPRKGAVAVGTGGHRGVPDQGQATAKKGSYGFKGC